MFPRLHCNSLFDTSLQFEIYFVAVLVNMLVIFITCTFPRGVCGVPNISEGVQNILGGVHPCTPRKTIAGFSMTTTTFKEISFLI